MKRFEYKGLEGIRAVRFNIGLNTSAIIYRLDRTIIETGPPNQWKAIRPFLRERCIVRALLTHHHEDHKSFEFDTLFCSHRGIIKNGLEAIREKLDSLMALCRQVKVLKETGLSAVEIGIRLLGRGDPLKWVTGSHFSKMNLIRACLSINEEVLGSVTENVE